MLETLFALSVLALSFARCVGNPFAPGLILVYVHSLAYWLRLRVPFFYANQSVLNVALAVVTILAFVWHYRRDRRLLRDLTATEQLLLLVIAYTWLSLTWSPGAEEFATFVAFKPLNFVGNQVIYLLVLPALFRRALPNLSFARELRFVGLTVLPVVALTLNVTDRSTEYLFLAFDPNTGDFAQASENPLQLAYFGSIMFLFAIIFVEWRLPSLLVHGAIAGLAAYLMLISESRGQLISTAAISMIVLPFRSRAFRSSHMLVFGPLIVLAALGFVLNASTIFTAALSSMGFDQDAINRFSSEGLSGDWLLRVGYFRDVLAEWKASGFAVVFGLGTGASFPIAGVYMHDVPVEVFFEQGVIVGCLFVIAIGLAIRDVALALDIATIPDRERRIMLFLAAQLIGLIIIAFKQETLTRSVELLSGAMFCAILARHLLRCYSPVRFVPAPALGRLYASSAR